MKRTVLLFSLILCTLLAWQCSSPDKKESKNGGEGGDSTAIKISSFIEDINQSSLTNFELGKLSEKSSTQEIREFGATMVAQDEQLLKEIRSLAESKNTTVSDSLDSRKQRKLNSLTGKSGMEFDKELIKLLSSEQRRLTSEFKKIDEVKDAELKAFVERNLPIIKSRGTDLRTMRKIFAPDKESRKREEKPA